MLVIAAWIAAASPAHLAIAEGSPNGLAIAWQQVISSPGDNWINDIVPLDSGDFGLTGFVGRSEDAKADWRVFARALAPADWTSPNPTFAARVLR